MCYYNLTLKKFFFVFPFLPFFHIFFLPWTENVRGLFASKLFWGEDTRWWFHLYFFVCLVFVYPSDLPHHWNFFSIYKSMLQSNITCQVGPVADNHWALFNAHKGESYWQYLNHGGPGQLLSVPMHLDGTGCFSECGV